MYIYCTHSHSHSYLLIDLARSHWRKVLNISAQQSWRYNAVHPSLFRILICLHFAFFIHSFLLFNVFIHSCVPVHTGHSNGWWRVRFHGWGVQRPEKGECSMTMAPPVRCSMTMGPPVPFSSTTTTVKLNGLVQWSLTHRPFLSSLLFLCRSPRSSGT